MDAKTLLLLAGLALLGLAGCFVPPVVEAGSGSTSSGQGASSTGSASGGSTGGAGSSGTTGSTGSASSSGAGASTGSSGGGGTTGGPDAGACADTHAWSFSLGSVLPFLIGVPGSDLPTQSQLAVWVRDERNQPVTGCVVQFAELPGENLVTLDPNSAALDANGMASTLATAGPAPGTATVWATLGSLGFPLQVTVALEAPDGGRL